jgi:hypothetical protein
MPHRVTNFLRSSTQSLENPVSNLKKTVASARRRRDSPDRVSRNSRGSERTFTYASSLDDDVDVLPLPAYTATPAVKPFASRMSESTRSNSFSSSEHKEHHHRISFPSMHFKRSNKDASHGNGHGGIASLQWQLESPPIVFYGDVENSTGALVSGQLFLDVKEDGLEFESFNATLNIHVTQKKPFTPHCFECCNQFTELQKWTFLQQPLSMAKGE